MSLTKAEKQVNVQIMLKSLGVLFNQITDSKVKQDYSALIFLLTRADGKAPPFEKILEIIDKHIKDTKLSKNTTTGATNKSEESFWTTVRTILIDTYNKNKGK
jgi:hypothetical protein